MNKMVLYFTSESIWRPDKIADQISDAVWILF